MSVYVRYMKMPESCLKCPMQFGGWCYVSPPEIDERVAPTVDEAAEQGKPEWCPLVEVPEPHGRLIDGDEFVRIWQGAKICGDIKPLVDVRPTVIEAEGER